MFDFSNMPGMPQMPFMPLMPFPFAGGAPCGATPSDQTAATGQDGAPTEDAPAAQVGTPMAQGMQLVPFPAPFISLMQMQLSMQMQMITQMQQVLSQMQQGGAAPQPGSAQLPFNMSIADLQKLLQIDASPKTLDVLQQVLDFIFDAYTKQQ